jgi:hypothetical protein
MKCRKWKNGHTETAVAASSLSDLDDRSEASGKLRLVLRSFEENSGNYLTKRNVKIGQFNAAAVGHC